jgi:hypothetical protein
MKKLLSVFFCAFILHCSGFSQRVVEYGLTFRNVDNFGFIYKRGSENHLLRLSILSLNNVSQHDNGKFVYHDNTLSSYEAISDRTSFGFGLGMGYEYRTKLSDNLNFVYGPQVGYSFLKDKFEPEVSAVGPASGVTSETSKINRFQLSMILGFNYSINDKFSFSAEIYPGYTFNKQNFEQRKIDANGYDFTSVDKTTKQNSFNFDTSSAMLTVSYRVTR